MKHQLQNMKLQDVLLYLVEYHLDANLWKVAEWKKKRGERVQL